MARRTRVGVKSMSTAILLEQPLSWRQVAAVAEGATLALSENAAQRIRAARLLVESIVAKGIRAYGVNTGVGALCDVVVDASQLRHLSRNIVMSHAVGMGQALGHCEVRAMLTAAINNFAHGRSGVRLEVVERLGWLLQQGWTPEVPAAGSVGYLSHMAHIALAVLGEGHVQRGADRCATADVLRVSNVTPLVLEAKEGLSLVNGTPCATGLMCLGLLRAERLLNWADVISAMSFENLHGQLSAFHPDAMVLRASAATSDVGERLCTILSGSALLAGSVGRRTQDPLSLRAIPHVHGAAREVFGRTAAVVDAELAAVTDNPVVMGTEDEPRALSQANATGAAIGLAADALGVAMAELVAMSERRIDRLVNPLVSGLPAFLASDSGAGSGFMIAQYAAVSLVSENRRLAAPARSPRACRRIICATPRPLRSSCSRSWIMPNSSWGSSCWPPPRPTICRPARSRVRPTRTSCTTRCVRGLRIIATIDLCMGISSACATSSVVRPPWISRRTSMLRTRTRRSTMRCAARRVMPTTSMIPRRGTIHRGAVRRAPPAKQWVRRSCRSKCCGRRPR